MEGTFKTFGTLPSESQEKSPRIAQLTQDVKDGFSTAEIIGNDPSFVLYVGTKKLVKRKKFEQFISQKLII